MDKFPTGLDGTILFSLVYAFTYHFVLVVGIRKFVKQLTPTRFEFRHRCHRSFSIAYTTPADLENYTESFGQSTKGHCATSTGGNFAFSE